MNLIDKVSREVNKAKELRQLNPMQDNGVYCDANQHSFIVVKFHPYQLDVRLVKFKKETDIIEAEISAILEAISLFPGANVFNDCKPAVEYCKKLFPGRNIVWVSRTKGGQRKADRLLNKLSNESN